MATVLGKRKSRTLKADASVAQEDAMAVFRRHFEAQFKPLAPTDQSAKSVSTPAPESASAPEAEDMRSDSEASDGSWDGVSDEEDSESEPDEPPSSTTSAAATVEVVSHTPTPSTALLSNLSKRESKAYLSSRPPSTTTATPSSSTTTASKRTKTPSDEDAPSLVKNDLALQRLLSESHLLSSSSSASSSGGSSVTEHTGRNRHLATDLRMAALGSRGSIYAQAKMPMAQRKGIAAAAAGREARRRREARENGVVLERPAAKREGRTKGGGMRTGRGRPVDAPAVGRLGGGTLRLSKSDIAEIEASGPRRSGGGGKRKRR